jgi:hypothetical protein
MTDARPELVLCPRCGRRALREKQSTPAGQMPFIVCRCLPEPFLDPGSVKVEAPGKETKR